MVTLKELAVGERWAYRVSEKGDPVEVEVLSIGSTAPARVEVKFVGEEPGEAKHWVPPTRLKFRWSERAAHLETEAKWRALVTEPDEVEWQAVDDVFRLVMGGAADTNWGKRKRGTIVVKDRARVDVAIGGGLDELVAASPSISDSDGTHYGWAVGLAIARRAAAIDPHRVMTYVHGEEAQGRRLAVGGRQPYSQKVSFVTPSHEAAFYDEFTRPLVDLLRNWCGEEAAGIRDDLRHARTEAARMSDLLVKTLALLADLGEDPLSWALYQRAFPNASRREWTAAVKVDAVTMGRWREGLSRSEDPKWER